MEYRRLGSSGLKVSVVGLGCNNFGTKCDQTATNAVVGKALDLGITLFDTADMYGKGGSESLLGKALGGHRQDVLIATKFRMAMGDGPYGSGASRHYIMNAVEASLDRLNTDYIDLYQIHFPDAETPIEETLRAMDDLVRQGKVRYIGCSNFSGWQLVDALWISETKGWDKFVSAQNHYNLLDRRIERDLVPAAEEKGVGILPYFPLASGALTGKYRRGADLPANTRLSLRKEMADNLLTDDNFTIIEKLTDFAEGAGHTMLDLAFGWLASQKSVSSVIAGATTSEQIEQNVKAGKWRLSEEELNEVNGLTFRHL